jgi:hypothetical protein
MNNKKILNIIIITHLLIFGIISSSNACLMNKHLSTKSDLLSSNKQIFVGWVNITGDGTEENSTIQINPKIDILIQTGNETSYVDFYLNYSTILNGSTDSSIITLFIQINEEDKGNVEKIEIFNRNETLKIENIEVHWKDRFSFEIGVFYINGIPPFEIHDIGFGGGFIGKKTKDVIQYTKNSQSILSYYFPIFNQLLNEVRY